MGWLNEPQGIFLYPVPVLRGRKQVVEVKARKGKVIAVATKGDRQIEKYADYTIFIPPIAEEFSPILAAIPLQLLAYHIAIKRGCHVDQPRNLAKSVTVE